MKKMQFVKTGGVGRTSQDYANFEPVTCYCPLYLAIFALVTCHFRLDLAIFAPVARDFLLDPAIFGAIARHFALTLPNLCK